MFLNKPDDIKAILLLSSLQEVPVTIRLRGIKKVFTSFFREIIFGDGTSPSILLETLSPDVGNEALPFSKIVCVEFNAPNPACPEKPETYIFPADFIQKETFEGKPVIRITLPDRRRYPRIEPSKTQPVKLLIEVGAVKSTGHLLNISEGGLGFYSSISTKTLCKDTKLQLSFVLPGGESIDADAVIRWAEHLSEHKVIEKIAYEYVYGVEFYRIDEQKNKLICSYILMREEEELKKIMGASLWSLFA